MGGDTRRRQVLQEAQSLGEQEMSGCFHAARDPSYLHHLAIGPWSTVGVFSGHTLGRRRFWHASGQTSCG